MGYVPKSKLTAALEANYEVVTPDDVKKYQAEKEYGGIGGMATSAGMSAAEFLSGGLAAPAVLGATEAIGGHDTKEALRRHLEGSALANPLSGYAGMAAGALVPVGEILAGLSGAEKVAAGLRAANTVPRAIMGAGGLGERIAARALGTEAKGLTGLAQRTIPRMVGAGIEGAAYSAGHELSDAAIHDHELTAENMLAATGRGLVFGGALGGGTSALSELGGAAMGLGRSIMGEGSTVAKALEDKANESMWHGVIGSGGKALTKRADRSAGGFREVASILREELPELTGKAIGKTTRGTELLAGAEAGTAKFGANLETRFNTLQDAAIAANKQITALDAVNSIRAAARELEDEGYGQGPQVKKIDEYADDVAKKLGLLDAEGNLVADSNVPISYKELQKIRRFADRQVRWSGVHPEYEGMYKVRDRMENDIENAFKTLLGDKELEGYLSDKKKWQAFDILTDAAKNASAGKGGNLGTTLTQKIVAGITSSIGLHAAGPIGALAGAGAGMLGAKLAREHGSFIAADLLGRASKLGAIENINSLMSEEIDTGVKAFLRGERAVGAVAAGDFAKGRKKREAYERQIEAITQLASNPGAMAEHVTREIGNLGPGTDSIQRNLATKLANGYNYLATVAPKRKSYGPTFTPFAEKKSFRQDEVERFGRAVDVIRHPNGVLDAIQKGRLTRDGVEAFKAFQPRRYELMGQSFVKHAGELRKKLNYKQTLQLGIWFGVPVDPSLQQERLASLQAPTEQNAAPDHEQGGSDKGTQRPLKLNTTLWDPSSGDVESA